VKLQKIRRLFVPPSNNIPENIKIRGSGHVFSCCACFLPFSFLFLLFSSRLRVFALII